MTRFALLLMFVAVAPALALDSGPPAQAFGPIMTSKANIRNLNVTPFENQIAPSLLDLRTIPPANGFYISGDGTYVDFCSATGCLQNYPGLLAQAYIRTTSRVDNAQEFALHVDFKSQTGFSPNWQPSTAYTNAVPSRPDQTSLVLVPGGFAGTLYRNVGGPCMSASSGSGPQGTNPNVDIADGTCRWRYYADGLNAGKSGLSVATTAEAGAAQTWGIVTAYNAGANLGDISMFPHEWDCNNYNKDSFLGGKFFMNCFYMGGGGGGTFPMFSAFYFDNANKTRAASDPNHFGYHYGLFFSGGSGDGGSVVKDATIFDATKSDYTLQSLTGQPKKAFLKDDSSSATVLQATGFHTYGVDMSNTIFSSGFAFLLPTSSFISLKNGLGAAIGYNGSSGCLQYGPDTSGQNAQLQICDSRTTMIKGDFVINSGGLRTYQTTVAESFPCGAPTKGLMVTFTDVAGTPTYRQTGFAGGGTQAVPGFCNGTSWELH